MSKELVPTTYDRNAYNAIHGVETRHHDGKLTAEQAREINENFDVFVVPVRHGIGLDRDPQALEKGFAPGDDDYEYVKRIINGMSHDDVLFTEGVGFTSENDASSYMPEGNLGEVRKRAYESKTGDDNPDVQKILNAHLRLESDRENYKIDSLTYAMDHAFFRGIKVILADMDSYDNNQLENLIDQEGRHPWGQPVNERLSAEANTIREGKAVNTIKDFALEKLKELPHQKDPHAPKRRLVLMFGGDHLDAFKERFARIGIEAHIVPPVVDDSLKRRNEFMAHIATKDVAA